MALYQIIVLGILYAVILSQSWNEWDRGTIPWLSVDSLNIRLRTGDIAKSQIESSSRYM